MFRGLNRSIFPFILYSLYSYVSLINTLSSGAHTKSLQHLSDFIKSHFLYRNDNSPTDQSIKTQTCSFMKRAGIHRNYLEEKGLLLPGYEEFEKRTAREDIQRIKNCEAKHETITFSGDGPGEPKDITSTIYYANVLLLLKKIGGNDAVKYFLRHNPIFHREFALPEKIFNDNPVNPHDNGILLLYRMTAVSILEEIYDDPEWQLTWQSIRSNHAKTFLSKNVPSLESVIHSIFSSTELPLLNRQIVFKD